MVVLPQAQPKRSHIGLFFGWLNSWLKPYPNTLNLKHGRTSADNGMRPYIELEQPITRLQSSSARAFPKRALLSSMYRWFMRSLPSKVTAGNVIRGLSVDRTIMMRINSAVGLLTVWFVGGFLFIRGNSGGAPRDESAVPRRSVSENAPAPTTAAGTPMIGTSAQDHDALPSGAWLEAERAIVRLSPDAFPDLPALIRAELHRHRCTVPQAFADVRPHNVIQGRFTSAAAADWAVLCSRNGYSSILIFPAGAGAPIAELSSGPDADWLQRAAPGSGPGAIGFSRAIGVARPQYIQERYKRYGGLKPPPLEHDGINDAFIEKASVVHYWYNGKWLELTGAD